MILASLGPPGPTRNYRILFVSVVVSILALVIAITVKGLWDDLAQILIISAAAGAAVGVGLHFIHKQRDAALNPSMSLNR